jgi:hypothetical protein
MNTNTRIKPDTGVDDLDEFVTRFATTAERNGQLQYVYQLYATPKIAKILRKGEIPLGYMEQNNPDSIVSVPFPQQSTNFLISGGKRGVGKSNLRALIGFDYLMGAQGLSGICIDPKREMFTHTKPNTKMEVLLDNFTLRPVGHENLVRLIPSMFANPEVFMGKEFQFDTSDMTVFDLTTLMQMDSRNYIAAQQRLEFMLFGDKVIKGEVNWRALRNTKLPTITELIKKARVMAGDRISSKDVLSRSLNNLVSNGAVGTEYPIDLIGLMKEGKVPIVQTDIDADLNPVASTYCAIILRKIIDERKLFVDSNGTRGRLRRPAVIDIGEFNIACPSNKNVSSKDPIKRIYDQMRYAGISIVADAPSFGSIAPFAIQQSDWVITFRMQSQADRDALRTRVTNRQILDSLADLKIFQERSWGMPPAEAALIDGDGNASVFLPLPCLSASLQEGEY